MIPKTCWFLCLYFAFVWQATLRSALAWHGFAPNFLVLAFIAVSLFFSDVSALLAAAGLGLLSDSLATRGLGQDVLCYVVLSILLQAICPPKFVRNPVVLVFIVASSTFVLEIATVILRAALNHEIRWNVPEIGQTLTPWTITAGGDAVYTATLAIIPLLIVRGFTLQMLKESQRDLTNRWHRLTS